MGKKTYAFFQLWGLTLLLAVPVGFYIGGIPRSGPELLGWFLGSSVNPVYWFFAWGIRGFILGASKPIKTPLKE